MNFQHSPREIVRSWGYNKSMITLPTPDTQAEDDWLNQWMMAADTDLIEVAQKALLERRTRFAGRIASLLDEHILANHPNLQRAQQAAQFRIMQGGLTNGEDLEEWTLLRRRRKQRMQRSKDRQRRSLSPKDPRFRRK